jgi:hypothetical protein
LTTEGRRQLTPWPAAKAGRDVRSEQGEWGGCHLPDHRRTSATSAVTGGEAEREALVRREGREATNVVAVGEADRNALAARREGRGRNDGDLARQRGPEGRKA